MKNKINELSSLPFLQFSPNVQKLSLSKQYNFFGHNMLISFYEESEGILCAMECIAHIRRGLIKRREIKESAEQLLGVTSPWFPQRENSRFEDWSPRAKRHGHTNTRPKSNQHNISLYLNISSWHRAHLGACLQMVKRDIRQIFQA